MTYKDLVTKREVSSEEEEDQEQEHKEINLEDIKNNIKSKLAH